MPDVLNELTDDLCSSIGSLTNASKIANTLQTVKGIKVSGTTIANYLNYLIESFLFSNAKRFDVKGKKYFEYPSKYYCADIGLRNARLNFRQQEETHIMENIIYNELLRRGYSVDVGVVEIVESANGKRSKKQCEIDFVVNIGAKKYYIQSALNVNDPSKPETELRPLKNTRDFFKATPHNYRLTPFSFTHLHLLRQLAQISLERRQPSCAQFIQSDEKSAA